MQSPARYELKYLLDLQTINSIRTSISELLEPDEHNDKNGYRVDSLYYDTPDLAWFWDKVEGEKIRTKMRVRIYPRGPLKAKTAFVEFKMKTGHIVTKRRLSLRTEQALSLCDGHLPDTFENQEHMRFCHDTLTLVHSLALRPTALTSYIRQAYTSANTYPKVRVTFDTLCKGKVNEPELFSDSPTFSFLPQNMGIMELKTSSGVPAWLLNILQFHKVKLSRMSKYCTVLAVGGEIKVLPFVSFPAHSAITGEKNHG